MKKFLALLMALTLLFSFCACGENAEENKEAGGLVEVWLMETIEDETATYTFKVEYTEDHELRKIISTEEFEGGVLVDTECQFLFDDQGRVLSDGLVTKQEGKFTCFSYDIYGNRIKEGVTYRYDEKGKIQTATDNRTKETTVYTYNDSGRVTLEAGPLEEISYAYDAAGRLTEKKSTTGWKAVYTYDELGRLVKVESGYEGEAAWVETYTYDENGNVAKIVAQSEEYNGGRPVAYEIKYKKVLVSESRAAALNAQKNHVISKLMTLTW